MFICFNFNQHVPVVSWGNESTKKVGVQESPPPPPRLKSAGALRGNVPEVGFEITKFLFDKGEILQIFSFFLMQCF